MVSAPDLLSVVTEFLSDQETPDAPYRNEAICKKARGG